MRESRRKPREEPAVSDGPAKPTPDLVQQLEQRVAELTAENEALQAGGRAAASAADGIAACVIPGSRETAGSLPEECDLLRFDAARLQIEMDEGAVGRPPCACQQPAVVGLDEADIGTVRRRSSLGMTGHELAISIACWQKLLPSGTAFNQCGIRSAVEDVRCVHRLAAQLVDGRVPILRPVVEQRQRRGMPRVARTLRTAAVCAGKSISSMGILGMKEMGKPRAAGVERKFYGRPDQPEGTSGNCRSWVGFSGLFSYGGWACTGGECEIRTHGRLPVGSFQDCWFKPLTQLSGLSLALRENVRAILVAACFGSRRAHRRMESAPSRASPSPRCPPPRHGAPRAPRAASR